MIVDLYIGKRCSNTYNKDPRIGCLICPFDSICIFAHKYLTNEELLLPMEYREELSIKGGQI